MIALVVVMINLLQEFLIQRKKAKEADNQYGFETRDWEDYHDGDFDIKCLWIEKVAVTNKIEDWWIHSRTEIKEK